MLIVDKEKIINRISTTIDKMQLNTCICIKLNNRKIYVTLKVSAEGFCYFIDNTTKDDSRWIFKKDIKDVDLYIKEFVDDNFELKTENSLNMVNM
jgi:AAA15 family ATPase/GTPase